MRIVHGKRVGFQGFGFGFKSTVFLGAALRMTSASAILPRKMPSGHFEAEFAGHPGTAFVYFRACEGL